MDWMLCFVLLIAVYHGVGSAPTADLHSAMQKLFTKPLTDVSEDKLEHFLRDDQVSHLFHEAMSMSPMIRKIVATAAKDNIMLRIYLKALNKEDPNLSDLAELLLHRPPAVIPHLAIVASQELNREISGQSGTTILQRIMKSGTQAHPVTDFKNSKYTITNNVPLQDTINVAVFAVHNLIPLIDGFKELGKRSPNVVDMFTDLLRLDFSAMHPQQGNLQNVMTMEGLTRLITATSGAFPESKHLMDIGILQEIAASNIVPFMEKTAKLVRLFVHLLQ